MHRNRLITTVVATALALVAWPGDRPAWADDDNNSAKKVGITEVLVTFENAEYGLSDTLTIRGANFDRSGVLSVTLGGQGALPILAVGPNEIVAQCFIDNGAAGQDDFLCADGDYLLRVALNKKAQDDDKKASNQDTHYLTIGAVGRVGPKGEMGDTGDAGAQGLTGTTGAKGEQGARGEMGDAGDQGPPGKAGPSGASAGDVRVASVIRKATGSCTIDSCHSSITFPECECSCIGAANNCECSCFIEGSGGCTSNTCVADAVPVACPPGGGGQGLPAVVCLPPSPGQLDGTTCKGGSVTAKGNDQSCSFSRTGHCSCSCFSAAGVPCTCSCRPNEVSISCNFSSQALGTQASAITAVAACLSIEAVP